MKNFWSKLWHADVINKSDTRLKRVISQRIGYNKMH